MLKHTKGSTLSPPLTINILLFHPPSHEWNENKCKKQGCYLQCSSLASKKNHAQARAQIVVVVIYTTVAMTAHNPCGDHLGNIQGRQKGPCKDKISWGFKWS